MKRGVGRNQAGSGRSEAGACNWPGQGETERGDCNGDRYREERSPGFA